MPGQDEDLKILCPHTSLRFWQENRANMLRLCLEVWVFNQLVRTYQTLPARESERNPVVYQLAKKRVYYQMNKRLNSEEFLDTIQAKLESQIPTPDHLWIYQEWTTAQNQGFIRQDLTDEWWEVPGNDRYLGLAAALQELHRFRGKCKKQQGEIMITSASTPSDPATIELTKKQINTLQRLTLLKGPSEEGSPMNTLWDKLLAAEESGTQSVDLYQVELLALHELIGE